MIHISTSDSVKLDYWNSLLDYIKLGHKSIADGWVVAVTLRNQYFSQFSVIQNFALRTYGLKTKACPFKRVKNHGPDFSSSYSSTTRLPRGQLKVGTTQ